MKRRNQRDRNGNSKRREDGPETGIERSIQSLYCLNYQSQREKGLEISEPVEACIADFTFNYTVGNTVGVSGLGLSNYCQGRPSCLQS